MTPQWPPITPMFYCRRLTTGWTPLNILGRTLTRIRLHRLLTLLRNILDQQVSNAVSASWSPLGGGGTNGMIDRGWSQFSTLWGLRLTIGPLVNKSFLDYKNECMNILFDFRESNNFLKCFSYLSMIYKMTLKVKIFEAKQDLKRNWQGIKPYSAQLLTYRLTSV